MEEIRKKKKKSLDMQFCNVCGEWVPDLEKHWNKRHRYKDNLELRDLK